MMMLQDVDLNICIPTSHVILTNPSIDSRDVGPPFIWDTTKDYDAASSSAWPVPGEDDQDLRGFDDWWEDP